jgi:hypothetical protein
MAVEASGRAASQPWGETHWDVSGNISMQIDLELGSRNTKTGKVQGPSARMDDRRDGLRLQKFDQCFLPFCFMRNTKFRCKLSFTQQTFDSGQPISKQ